MKKGCMQGTLKKFCLLLALVVVNMAAFVPEHIEDIDMAAGLRRVRGTGDLYCQL